MMQIRLWRTADTDILVEAEKQDGCKPFSATALIIKHIDASGRLIFKNPFSIPSIIVKTDEASGDSQIRSVPEILKETEEAAKRRALDALDNLVAGLGHIEITTEAAGFFGFGSIASAASANGRAAVQIDLPELLGDRNAGPERAA